MEKMYNEMTREELVEELGNLKRSYKKMTKTDRNIAFRRILILREILSQKS